MSVFNTKSNIYVLNINHFHGIYLHFMAAAAAWALERGETGFQLLLEKYYLCARSNICTEIKSVERRPKYFSLKYFVIKLDESIQHEQFQIAQFILHLWNRISVSVAT